MFELTPIERFTEAAVEWAGGGRGQVVVDAAATALAEGLDSPSLRVLAGAPSRFADDEASEVAPDVFAELGIAIEERLTPRAIVRGAQLVAVRFLESNDNDPRRLSEQLHFMCVEAGYPSELNFWPGIKEDYSLLDDGFSSGSEEHLSRAVTEAAQKLVDGELIPGHKWIEAEAETDQPASDLQPGQRPSRWRRWRSRVRQRRA